MSMIGNYEVPKDFMYGMLVFALITSIVFPVMINMYFPINDAEGETLQDLENQLNTQYYDMTGSQPTSRSVWVLSGIYTPFQSNHYGYTEDGWLYGDRIVNYTPKQYEANNLINYTVKYDATNKVYLYSSLPGETPNAQGGYDINDGIKNSRIRQDVKIGDLYTQVAMDSTQTSDVFFTTDNKTITDTGFYYDYNGYRYTFQPLTDYVTSNDNTENRTVNVTSATTSLSLIWYKMPTASGLAGQLVLSGSDSGVGYLTTSQIVNAFNNTTSTSDFTMKFNGVDVRITISIDPYYLAQSGMTVASCFDAGYWSIMVSTESVKSNAWFSESYDFNPSSIFNTMIDLFMFNLSDYGLSGWTATLASLVYMLPMYAALITIGMSCYPVLIFAGILAAIQSLSKLSLF